MEKCTMDDCNQPIGLNGAEKWDFCYDCAKDYVGTCARPGCTRIRHPEGKGSAFDYCGNYCRSLKDQPIKIIPSQKKPNNSKTNISQKCKLCSRPKYIEPNGRVHDYCSKKCARADGALN